MKIYKIYLSTLLFFSINASLVATPISVATFQSIIESAKNRAISDEDWKNEAENDLLSCSRHEQKEVFERVFNYILIYEGPDINTFFFLKRVLSFCSIKRYFQGRMNEQAQQELYARIKNINLLDEWNFFLKINNYWTPEVSKKKLELIDVTFDTLFEKACEIKNSH